MKKEKNIIIFDYGLGNLKSIFNAFSKVGADVSVTNNLQELDNSSGMVFPGVGSFSAAKQVLEEQELFNPLKKYLNSGKPVLGICLGMQLLLSVGEENGINQGFGVINGRVKVIGNSSPDFKLPNIGWLKINKKMKNSNMFDNSILKNMDGLRQYFVHSYAVIPEDDKTVLATTQYCGKEFICAIQHENITGVQFHPEKSGPAGLNIISNFVSFVNKLS